MFKAVPKLLLVTLLTFPVLLVKPSQAAISSCSASISPNSAHTNTSISLNLDITNNDSANNVVWVKVNSPSSDYRILGGGPWSASTNSNTEVVFTGGSIPPSSSQTFNISIRTSGNQTSASNFSVSVSDDGGGGSASSCPGSLAVEISDTSDTSPPNISNITASGITQNQATISWNTDEVSRSEIFYGTTNTYGNNQVNSNTSTSHSFVLSNLVTGVTYHFKVKNTDSANNSSESGDNTFTTLSPTETQAPVPENQNAGSSDNSPSKSNVIDTTGTSISISPSTLSTLIPVPIDRTPPSVLITTKLDKTFQVAPRIEGKVTDNEGVAKVEYSTDNSKNWLPIQIPKGSKLLPFAFNPALRDDGTYIIGVRAFDLKGNVGYSKTYTLLIDRLDPQIGAFIVSLGPQILNDFSTGDITILAGLEYKITLSSIGGASYIDLTALEEGGKEYKFLMNKNDDTNLWSTSLKLNKPGPYQLVVSLSDGGSKQFSKQLTDLAVVERGEVVGDKKGIKNAELTLYYYEQSLGKFILWDGEPFGVQNPQKIDGDGKYTLFVPAGRFYLDISFSGYKKAKSRIFETTQPFVINQTIQLESPGSSGPLSYFAFPWLNINYFQIKTEKQEGLTESKQLNLTIPEFSVSVSADNQNQVSSTSLKGKTTLISILNTWMPQTNQQLLYLESLLPEKKLNLVPIIPHESPSSISVYKKRGGYKLNILSDRDGKLIDPLGIQTIPTHYFVDKNGVIKKVRLGLLTTDELKKELQKLDN